MFSVWSIGQWEGQRKSKLLHAKQQLGDIPEFVQKNDFIIIYAIIMIQLL